MSIQFDEHQQKAIQACKDNKHISVFITGQGGSGKSAIIKHICKYYQSKNIKYTLLAPTNSASKNIGGVTVHSHFGLKPYENIQTSNEDNFILFDNFLDEDDMLGDDDEVLIFDEVSMCGEKLIAKTLNKAVYTKLILFGDLNQLPPPKDKVVNWYKIADITIELKVNYRATNPIVKSQIDYFKKFKKYKSDIEMFDKSKFNEDIKIIAFRNQTLSHYENLYLGKNYNRSGIKHILSSPIYAKGKKVFDNGDTVIIDKYLGSIGKNEIDRYFIEKKQTKYELKEYSIKHDIPDLKYPLKIIIGDYDDYKEIKDNRFREFKDIINRLCDKYKKSEKDVWSLYREKKLDFDESFELRHTYGKYINIKKTPYARNHQFVTTYKAQGKGYDTIAIAIDDFRDNAHAYVAISRAINKIYLIK